jgi:hypothetical protein
VTPARSRSEAPRSTTDTAAAPVSFPDSIWLRMKTDETSVLNGMLPEIRISEPNSPRARAKASAIPALRPGRRLGKMIRRNTVKPLAPREAAASSMSRSSSSSSGCTARTTKGRVTNSSAITTAVRVKAMSTPIGLVLP